MPKTVRVDNEPDYTVICRRPAGLHLGLKFKGGTHTPAGQQAPVPNLKVEAALSHIAHTYKDVEAKDITESIEKEPADFDADLLVLVPHRAGLWRAAC